ncbi:MAG: hypothetical protein ACKOOI_02585 [Pirellula sp.]
MVFWPSCIGLNSGFGGILGGAPIFEPSKFTGTKIGWPELEGFAGSKQASCCRSIESIQAADFSVWSPGIQSV